MTDAIAKLQGKPTEKQREFFASTARHTAYGGARGGGKSWAMRRKMVGLGIAPYGGIRMLLLRRSFPELLGNHIKPLIEELVPTGIATYSKDERIFTFPNGSYIKLGYCDSEDDWMQYQGQEYEVIGFEEATNFTEMQMRKIATSNRTSRKDFKPRCYYTCNPGGVGHEYIKRLFVDRNFIQEPIMFEGMEILPENPDDYVFIRAKLNDNPHVDPDYVKSLAGLPEHLRRAYLEGDWDVVLGQYFSDFRRDLHVVPEMLIPTEWRKFRAMDWGYNDPWCTLWFAVSPDRHIYVYRELYAREMNSSDYARLVRQMTGSDEQISGTYLSPDAWQRRGMKDISGGENIAEVLMRNGIPVLKADNSRVIGWQRVRENLAIAPDGEPWLRIMENCHNLIRTFPNATVDENNIEDVSGHCEDHALEALRYGLMSRPSPKTVRQIPQQQGDIYIDPFNQRRSVPRSTSFYNLK
jgi:phage terminase large subunit